MPKMPSAIASALSRNTKNLFRALQSIRRSIIAELLLLSSERSRGIPLRNRKADIHGILRLRCAPLRMTNGAPVDQRLDHFSFQLVLVKISQCALHRRFRIDEEICAGDHSLAFAQPQLDRVRVA